MKKATVTDATVLELLHSVHAEGLVVEGGYKSVWEQLSEAFDLGAPFSQRRAQQLARVGRRFELHTELPFTVLCPDLPAHASNWNSALA